MPNEKRRKSDQTIEKLRSWGYLIMLFLGISGILGGGVIKAYILPAAEEIAEEVVREKAFPAVDGLLMQKDIEYIKETVDKILDKINKDGGK